MGLAADETRLARKLVRAQLLAVLEPAVRFALELAVPLWLELAVLLWLELAWQLVLLKPSVQLAAQLI